VRVQSAPNAVLPADLAAAVALAASWVGAGWLRALPGRSEVPALLPLLAAWAVLAAVAGFRGERRGVAPIVALAVAARLPWVGTPPLWSDDLYRYLFEGAALARGHDVFRHAPAALSGVDDALRALVNHPDVPSVYPPLALWWFRALATVGTVTGTQAMTAAADVAAVALTARWGSARGALVLALHPLAVIESASGAHVDVPAVALAVTALSASRSGRPALAAFAAVLGVWTKLFPVVLAPPLLRPLSTRARLAALVGGGLLGPALAAPLLTWGPHLGTGLRAYASTWAFSGFAYPWLSPLLGEATRPLLLAAAAGAVGVTGLRLRDPAAVWAVAGTVFCLTSPTVHPWYVLWALVPSLFLGRGEWALASIGSLFSYGVLAGFDPETGRWTEVPGLWWVVWGTAAAGAVAGRRLAAHRERSDDQPTAP
jgi:alpha-1,6-mannosyltransferase